MASRSSASSLFSRRMARTLLLNRSPGVPVPMASSVMWYSCRSALGTSGWRTRGTPWPCAGAGVGPVAAPYRPGRAHPLNFPRPFPVPLSFQPVPSDAEWRKYAPHALWGKPAAPSKVRSAGGTAILVDPLNQRNRRPPAKVTSVPIRSRSAAAVSVSSRGGGGCPSFAAGGSGVGKSPITRSHFFSSRS